MSGATYPPNLLAAIASSAGGSYITNPMPLTSTGTNAASIEGGMPPITMQPEVSGGEPPLGQDVNGFLFLLSSHTLFVECGQGYNFNSTLAASISGYLAGSVLAMADGTGFWLNTTNGNSNNPDTGGAGWVPLSAYGNTTVNTSAAVGGILTLTAAQARYGVIIINGTLTGNVIVQFPQTLQSWLVINNTTGAFTLTAQTAAGGSSGVTVPAGGLSSPTGIYSIGDGNIYPSFAPLTVPISQAATPLTLAERTSAGYILATYFNQSSAVEAPTIGSVFVQNTAADGYLRKVSNANFISGLTLVTSAVLASTLAAYATKANPTLTGNVGVPTRSPGDNTANAASTAFVVAALAANGYQVKAGSFNCINGTVAVNFATAFPTQCIAVVVQWEYSAPDVGNVVPSTRSKNGFSYANGNAGACTYIAVGN